VPGTFPHGTNKVSFFFWKCHLKSFLINLLNYINKKIFLGFSELLNFEGVEPNDKILQKFNNQLRTILRRHNTVVETMAEALIELKQSRSQGLELTCERNIQVNSQTEI
jgi:hypothetical protein